MPAVLAALAALASLGVLLLPERAARALNLVDDPASAPERKQQPRAVPRTGGLALAAGLAVLWCAAPEVFPPAPQRFWLAAALVFALCVGLVDDIVRGGLGARTKFAGQLALAACVVLAFPELGTWQRAGLILAVVAAVNAANTFDHADGALAGVSLLGLAAASPWLALPVLVFLPFNLWLRRGGAPRAYLGDGGSGLLGLLLVLQPASAPALLVPALDLARVAIERLSEGASPFQGDRRHIGQRLAARGLGASAVAGLLALTAAPALCLPDPWGFAASTLGFCMLVGASRPLPR